MLRERVGIARTVLVVIVVIIIAVAGIGAYCRPHIFQLESFQFFDDDIFYFIVPHHEFNLCHQFDEHNTTNNNTHNINIIININIINLIIFEHVYQHFVDVLHDDYHHHSACEHHHTAAQRLFSHHSDLPRRSQRNSFQLHHELSSVVCEFDDIQGQHHLHITQ